MKIGVVSGRAISRVKPGYPGNYNDTGTGPVGLIGSDHINAAAQQKAGKNFGNAESDFGAADAGSINARANARDYYGPVKGKDPFCKSSWKPEWFNKGLMGKLGDRSSDPASDTGGPSGVERGDTGTSWKDRAMRGE
jgi:hypothetical protein